MSISQNYSLNYLHNIQGLPFNTEQEDTNPNPSYSDLEKTTTNHISLLNLDDHTIYNVPPLDSHEKTNQFPQELQVYQCQQIENEMEQSCKDPKDQTMSKKLKRVSLKRRAQIIQAKNQGTSIRKICKQFKISRHTLERHNILGKEYAMGFVLNAQGKLERFFNEQWTYLSPLEKIQKLHLPTTILSSTFRNNTFHKVETTQSQESSLRILKKQLDKFVAEKRLEIINERNNGSSITAICEKFKIHRRTLYKYHMLNKPMKRPKFKFPLIETCKKPVPMTI